MSLGDLGKAVLDVPPIEEEGDAPLVEADLGLTFIFNLVAQ